jgi:NAD(P)-dependent dehydrogenase (short-subunit alcohol dehydrogenase family)
MSELAGPRLDDRVVVLTGASSGLGDQLARALHGAGARLVLAARRKERLDALNGELGGDHEVVACDVASQEDREALVAAAVERFGRIDGLVNNAGVTNIMPALKETLEDFRRVLEVNLVAPFDLARLCAQRMRETGGGAIVNVASIVSVRHLLFVPQASYAASKAGLAGITRELAAQWTRYDIRVNAVAPGAFGSEMTGDEFEETGRLGQLIKVRVPMGRPGRPGELDGMVLALLHPSTSYVTGQVIPVDGGFTAA